MEIRIKVEKNAVPDKQFFSDLWEVITEHGWYLSSGDKVDVNGIRLERNYSSFEVTKLAGVIDEED